MKRLSIFIIALLFLIACTPTGAEEEAEVVSLTTAVSQGDMLATQTLIDADTDIEATDDQGHTPLLIAAQRGVVNIGRVLIENGANVYAVDNNGAPALTLAAQQNQPEFVQLLLENGANPNFLDAQKRTALDYAREQGNEDVVAILAEVTAEEPFVAMNSALFTAVRNDDIQNAKNALTGGAIIDAEDDTNHLRLQPIQVAVLRGNIEMLNFLIDNGADPFIIDRNGDALLFHAVTSGNADMVKLFLENGLDVNVVTSEFASGNLSVAARDGSIEIGKLLIEYGADLEMPDQNGDPPLNSAAYFGQTEFIKMLIEAGAKTDSVSLFGDNALTYAESQGFPELATFLREEVGLTAPVPESES